MITTVGIACSFLSTRLTGGKGRWTSLHLPEVANKLRAKNAGEKKLKTLSKLICVFAVVVAVALPISAQWPVYQTRRVPRTADGKPDLTAPTPRTADGKPDLSGIWDNGRNTNVQRGGRGADFNAAPPANRGQAAAAAAGPPSATFANVGAGFPDDLPFQPWAADLMKK